MSETPASRLYHPAVTAALAGTKWETPIEVQLSALNVDPRYQSPFSESRARGLARNFRRDAACAIVVSLREDGTLWIIDGQHRVGAAKKVLLKTILAWVYVGLSLKEEAALFAELNTQRKSPTSRAVFNALLCADQEPYISIHQTVREAGLTLSLTNTKGSHSIVCIGTVVSIWRSGGKERLSRVLNIAKAAWPSDDRAFDSYILAGLSHLIKAVDGKHSDERLAQRLSIVAPELLVRGGVLRKHDSGDEMGRCVGFVMLKHVEKRMRRANRSGSYEDAA